MPLRGMEKNYKAAIDLLNSRRRLKRPSLVLGIGQDEKDKADLRGTPSIVGMRQWLSLIGHSPSDIDRLNIIHVAGTKGKGSTSAFADSFLRASATRTGFPRKTGLYTSPHLIYPEERIRINFTPLPRDLFARYVFEVWEAVAKRDSSSANLPRYLQLLLLVSFHAFIEQGVEATILETHHGGEYDATNVIDRPVATVITTLGMDHVKQLGPGIENIAWHKAGIFKSGVPAFSAPQTVEAADVLRSRAAEKGVELEFVAEEPGLPDGLGPGVQRMNCSLALAAVRCFLGDAGLSTEDVLQGIGQFAWPGRFQLIVDGPFSWFLDGAHNEMSVTQAAEWFIQGSQGSSAPRILIFGQVSKQRDGAIVVKQLAKALSPARISHVIFTLYDPKEDFDAPPLSTDQQQTAEAELSSLQPFGQAWASIHGDSRVHYEPNVQQALDAARRIGEGAGGMRTLVTGIPCEQARQLNPTDPQTGACPNGKIDKLFINGNSEMTDRAWNLINLNPTLHGTWSRFGFGFKWLGLEDLAEDKAKVTVQFHWLPAPRDVKPMEEVKELSLTSGLLAKIHDAPRAANVGYHFLASSQPVMTGHTFSIEMPKDDARNFSSAIKLQWVMIRIGAMAGAANDPTLSWGNGHREGSEGSDILTWLEGN
ncbi:hypothetical protein CDD80_2770 [Ophiocordyceps camponoti-rufipedis]|uniref:tetrahydrofolate synthase n=1 Tax=Ophiocordyceps camponoti-rufipedis TaxID=2004952 RepID=A0A2C5Y9Z9_9HYPO|nr:hypothetical protein CDD80_2770 [Ophiocordyceps camponoti-rufipedis]